MFYDPNKKETSRMDSFVQAGIEGISGLRARSAEATKSFVDAESRGQHLENSATP